jgi:D-galactarolactone cycloisomerase
MKIQCVRTYQLRCQLAEPFAWSQNRTTTRESLLVEIITETGEVGWGECFGPAAVNQAAVASVYAPRILRLDPLETDVIWHQLWQGTFDAARRGVMLAAISGIDMALWDLKGVVLGQPVSTLMGGRARDQVLGYATGMYFRDLPEPALVDALVAEAVGYRDQGFTALKIKIGKRLDFDERLVVAVRQALPELTLMADANHAYDLPEAIRIGRILGEHRFAWFEEPTSPEHPQLYRQLHDKVAVPLAAGECEQTRYGFQALLAPGGIQFAQPDLGYCGGPSEALKIRAVAAALGVNVVPHAWGTMVNLAATAHFLASAYQEPGRKESAGPMLECDRSPNPLRDELFSTPVQLARGTVQVPNAPGLGVAVDAAALRSFCAHRTETT